MGKKPEVRVIVVYHKPAILIKSDVFIPVHVGRALAIKENGLSYNNRWLKASMIGDDTGDNISRLNKCYAELTAIYWAWKNYTKLGNPNYIGFMHYRRFMLFRDGYPIEESFKTSNVIDAVKGTDICLLEKIGAYSKKSGKYMQDIATQYAEVHQKEDLNLLERIVQEDYPEMMSALRTIFSSAKISWKNIFVMRREIFMEYCSFCFEIMAKIEHFCNWASNKEEELRVCGFLSEIVLNIWLRHQDDKGRKFKIKYFKQVMYEKELPRAVFSSFKERKGIFTIEHFQKKRTVRLWRLPIWKTRISALFATHTFLGLFRVKKSIPQLTASNSASMKNILLCFDNTYYWHSYVLLNSIFKTNQSSRFCIHVMYSVLKDEYRENLLDWVCRQGHGIQFYHLHRGDFSFCPIKKGDKVTVETYYRLFAEDFLPKQIDKVLYLDIDTLCLRNISSLFDTDMEDCPLLATYGDAPDERKISLGLSPHDKYYQAGVTLMNFSYWRQHRCTEGIRQYIKTHRSYLERWDQDAINGYFKNKIGYLPVKYNAYSTFFQYESAFSNRLPVLQHPLAERVEAIEHPVIVHFTGFDQLKPWWENSEANAQKRRWWMSYFKGTPAEKEGLKEYRIPVRDRLKKEEGKSSASKGNRNERVIVDHKELEKASLFAQAIQALHRRTFPQFKNIHAGKDVVVVGCGPTLNYYRNVARAIHIGVNRAFLSGNVSLDYLFMQDYSNIKDIISSACDYKRGQCVKFFGLFPDTNHFMHIPDYWAEKAGAFRYYVNETKELYAEQIYYDIENFPLAQFWASGFQALHFAFYTSPRTIYLVGFDCDFSGYFNKQLQRLGADRHVVNERDSALHLAKIQHGYLKFRKFQRIYYPQTKIVSINPVGLRGLFRDVYTASFIKEHPEIKKYDLLEGD